MGDDAIGPEEENEAKAAFTPRRITADPRKFSHYVLDPLNARGKDRVFVGLLGFRPHSVEDARALAEMYVAQARMRIAAGEYSTGEETPYGQRIWDCYRCSRRRRVHRLVPAPGWLANLGNSLSGFCQNPRLI